MLHRSKSPHAHGPSGIWQRGDAKRAIARERRRLGERLRALREARGLSQEGAAEIIGLHAKHLQRIEAATANATTATLVAVALAYGTTVAELFGGETGERAARPRRPAAAAPTPATTAPLRPAGAVRARRAVAAAPARTRPPAPPDSAGEAVAFRIVAPARVRPFRNALPLYPLRVAAGAFGPDSAGEPPEPEAWVAPSGRTRPRPGLFVARVTGRSMSRRIPDGAFCIFRTPVAGGRHGRVVLVQHRDVQDPDHGGRFTVKIWRSRKVAAGPDSWRHVEVRLEPDSLDPGYRPIVIRDAADGEIAAIAELVEVLPGRAPAKT